MISAILLAAGQSQRMKGQNKLLKHYKGKYLINHILNTLVKSKVKNIFLVLGFQNLKVRKIIIKSEKIKCIYNKKYKSGLSSSIQTGLKKISKKNIGFLIVHADMPLVSKRIINVLCSAVKNKNKEIFVPVYKKKFGNPLAFRYSMIKFLKKIKGDKGAKKIIKTNKSKIKFIKFNSKSILIDFDQLKDFPSAI